MKFEKGIEYLVYMELRHNKFRIITPCSGTKRMDYAILDRYLLGIPKRGVISQHEVLTLEQIYALLNTDHARRASQALGSLKSQSREIVPVLLDFAKGYKLGDGVEALRAIGMLGRSAEFSAPELANIFNDQRWYHDRLWYKPDIRAEALSSFYDVSSDRWAVKKLVYAGLSDSAWEVRREAVSLAPNIVYWEKLRYRDPLVRKVLARLNDEHISVRDKALSAVMATMPLKKLAKPKIRKMQKYDPDQNIRERARYILRFH